jgi:WD40 repeat protein
MCQPLAGLPPRLRHILTGHGDWVWMVAFHPDGQTLASCSDDATIKLWSVADGTCLQTLRTPDPYAGMRIRGVRGLSDAQRNALIALGAVA